MRVLFFGALTHIIVGFYPDFKPWRPSRRGTVLHMGFLLRSRTLAVAVVCSAVALAFAGCDGAGRGTHPVREGGDGATLTSTTPTPPGTPTAQSITKAFDSIRKRFAGSILGICMGAIDQQTRAIKCYGRVSPGSKKKPTRTTLFQIGSVSKTFTATLLALRVKSGAVGLQDPARQYLPAGPGDTQVPPSMTLLDLADHYSGLSRDTPSGEHPPATVEKYLSEAGSCSASSQCRSGQPGRRYSYSNYGYGVLGELLALRDGFSQGGASWEQDNNANVSGPLGLADTHSWLGWQAISPATFDARRARPVRHAVPPYFPPAPYADAAAGLYSSANDMVKWLSYSMGLSGTPELDAARPYLYNTPALLRPREDQSDKRRRVGLAWRVDTHGSGKTKVQCVYKDGLTRGFTTSMIFIKDRGVGAFVMLNTEPDTPAIAAALVNALPSAKKIARSACGSGGG
jgi:D-alanyl-D-alanine-carboxypeptidase/D-alanyl-D-alanine-endopeptidase